MENTNKSENQNTEVKKDYVDISKDNIIGREGLDLSNFMGTNTKIENVRLRVFNKGTKDERYAFEIETLEFEIKEYKVRAKEYINCWKDKEDNTKFVYSTSTNSNSYKLLKYFNVENPMDLVGKECEVRRKIQDNGKERLGIIF